MRVSPIVRQTVTAANPKLGRALRAGELVSQIASRGISGSLALSVLGFILRPKTQAKKNEVFMEPTISTQKSESTPTMSYAVETSLNGTLQEARTAGVDGLQDPHPMVLKTRLAYEHARDFFQGQLERAERNIPEMETDLQTKHRALLEADKKLLQKWNESPRLVRDRAEAKAAKDTYNEEMNAPLDGWQIFVFVLFMFEFAFGYWIFKTFVLPDPGFGNELTSVLIGAMTVVIGFLLKSMPDSTRDLEKYARAKKILAIGSAISATVFIILLAAIRQTSESLLPGTTDGAEPSKIQDFIFQLSLLATLIFSAAFFAHWKKKFPKALLNAMNQEAKDLQAWYDSEEYQYTKLQGEISVLEEKIASTKKERDRLRDKVRTYSDRRLYTLMQESCLAFIDGALTLPHTEAKQKAASFGRSYLDTLVKSRLEH